MTINSLFSPATNADNSSSSSKVDNSSAESYSSFLNEPLGKSFSFGSMQSSFNAASATPSSSTSSISSGSNSVPKKPITLTSPNGTVGGLTFEPSNAFNSQSGTIKLKGKTIGSWNGNGVAVINRGDSAVAKLLGGGKGHGSKPLAIKGVIMQNDDDAGAKQGVADKIGNFIRDPGTIIQDKVIGNQGSSTRLSS